MRIKKHIFIFVCFIELLYGCSSSDITKDYLFRACHSPDIEDEMILGFYRSPGFIKATAMRASVYLRTDKAYKKLFIKRVYFEYLGKEYTILKDIKENIPLMYKSTNGYYTQSEAKYNDGEFFVGGSINLSKIFNNSMEVGEEIEILIRKEYSFDNESLKIRAFPYTIKCIDRKDLILYW